MSSTVEGTVAWLKKQPPEKRAGILNYLERSPSREVRRIAAAARAAIHLAEKHACSKTRVDAFRFQDEPYRVKGMKLSKYGSRISDSPGVLETRRWTPPHSVSLEDKYDKMDAIEAAACMDPPSVTGIQFQQLEMRNGREKSRKPPKKKKAKSAPKRGGALNA